MNTKILIHIELPKCRLAAETKKELTESIVQDVKGQLEMYPIDMITDFTWENSQVHAFYIETPGLSK